MTVAVKVKPLVWRGSYGCLIAKGVGVEYYAFTKGWNTSLDGTTHPAESREDAKAACQAHHEALLRAELILHPADPLSDPRVVALVEALNGCIVAIEHANMADGVCCCGDNMEGHSEPMNCGHSPVDMGEYHAHQVLTAARAALRAIGGEA